MAVATGSNMVSPPSSPKELVRVAIAPHSASPEEKRYVWVNLYLLKRLETKNAELVRTGVNLLSTLAVAHLTHWPLPAWLWLPFIALAFDQFERKIATTILIAMSAGMAVLSFVGGLAVIYPLSFTAFAIFCARISKMRVGEISNMLLAGDIQRRELEKAHRATRAAHEELTRETEARQLVELELRQAHRLEAVVALAAGMAHEINTPVQYAGGLRFVREGIVRSMKEFAQPPRAEMVAISDGGKGGGELGRIIVSTRCDGRDVIVSVQDDSIGISDDIRDRIFDPFFTTRNVGTGMGQGLSPLHERSSRVTAAPLPSNPLKAAERPFSCAFRFFHRRAGGDGG